MRVHVTHLFIFFLADVNNACNTFARYLDLFVRVQLHVVLEKYIYILTAAPEFKRDGVFVNTYGRGGFLV